MNDRRLPMLRRFAALCAVLVLAITSLSAFIRLSGAGLGCADWPACYGRALREAQQGATPTAEGAQARAVARLAHRIVAVAALLLVITMAMACLASQPPLWREGRSALALLGLALFLAVLGRWSSGARVPAVTLGNLLGGFAMLALCWRLLRSAGSAPLPAARLARWARVAVVLLVLQIALGGLVSAGYAGLSCTAWPDCGGHWTVLSWQSLNPWHEPVFDATLPINPPGALAHMAHRAGAVVLAVVLLPLGVAALRSGRRGAGAAVLALLAAQLGLGLAMVLTALPLALALAHNLVAGLLLALLVGLADGD
jgi:cytochrome c oxidase assembly protein subunit 15